ncbi:hypothetical protein QTP86_012302 [Hemibagrus guttatus]|nr:hypothetical protein QTP86_012302 [Hemibagrus guttatus]
MGSSMRLILGVVNLLLFLLPCVSTQHCPAKISPPDLDSPESWPVQKPFHTGFMSSIVHSFLSSVQPNRFPKELFIKVLKSPGIDTATIKEFLSYELGFLVCVAIGILYIILMPLIGMCFACCRCCGNCGGHMYQEKTNGINCRRRSFYWATFLITILILSGNICMFLSNTYTHENVRTAPGEFNHTLKNLQSYISIIPEQVEEVVNESVVVVDNVTNNIKGIGLLLGREIQRGIEGSINPALDSAAIMAQVLQNTSLFLSTLNTTQKELDVLQTNLTGVKTRVNKTLHYPECMKCLVLQSELDKLSLASGLNGKNFFESIPVKVTEATRDSVQMVQQDLQTIKSQVTEVTKGIPLNQLTTFSDTLNTVQEETKNYTSWIDLAEKIRWNIAVILCCLILLVVVCNLLGLILGPAGLVPRDDPTVRTSTANCGGLFLMTGVGFSFLFSWIFMIVVLILFLVGGNMYTLICVPWNNQQLFELIDTPGVIPGLQLSQSLGLKTNLTISDVYKDCQMNKSLWNTLHLEDIIDLNNYLNVSNYTGQVQKALESSNITLPSIVLLDNETKKQLNSFSATASSVNISSIRMRKVITPSIIGLSYIADNLEALANNQTNATVKAELQNEAKDLRFIQTQFNSTINPQLGTVQNVLKFVGSAQGVLNNTMTQTVKSKLTEFIDCQIGVFTELADWAKQTNAFWFSLGWCMVFLIPSIIFSVKLAKFYRRMKHKDEYLDNLMLNPIPRVNLKPY